MPNSPVLCQRLGTTASQLGEWLRADERGKVAEFLEQRFLERYFTPVEALNKDEKNGFATIALSCLVVESLQSHYYGWPSTNGKSEFAFCRFFDREDRFSVFRGFANAFYVNVRCGVLHQGETTGGWRVRRDGPLFDSTRLCVNATKFHRALRGSLSEYVNKLQHPAADDSLWKNCHKKLKAVIANCGSTGIVQ